MQRYPTIEDQINLLTEKGYLESNFKTPGQLGEWIREFRAALDHAREQASINDGASTFVMTLYGKFNEGLDTVAFQLHYVYGLENDELHLFGIRAHINKGDLQYADAKIRRSYQIDDPSDLKPPIEIYQRLTVFDKEENDLSFYVRLYRSQQKERDRDNDPKPDPANDPYNDPKDRFVYDSEAEITRWNFDKFPKFIKKPRGEEFKPDTRPKLGVPDHIKEKLLKNDPLKPPPPFPKIKRR